MSSHDHASDSTEHDSISGPRSPLWLQLFIRHFPRRDFVVGGLIPLLLYSILSRAERPLAGIVAAASWGLGVASFTWWRTRCIEGFAVLAVIFAAVQILTTLITRNPALFLLSGAINNAVEGLVYFASLLLPRPLIQIAAEATGATESIRLNLRQSSAYRRAWQILTATWGIVNVGKAIVMVLAERWLPLDAALVLGILLGWPLFVGLLAFTFWFPGWYWSRRADL